MPGSVAGAMSGGPISGAPITKKNVKDLLKPDKKATKKFSARKKGY